MKIQIIYFRYIVYENGKIYDIEKQEYLKHDKKWRYTIIINGEAVKKSQKVLYRKAYGKEFCIDKIKNLKGEQWKQIDYDNRYFISSKGRVKSYCGYNAIILKPQKKKNGYLEVMIRGKHKYIHRLVAEAFIENKYNLDTVDHLDFIRDNNDLLNLRYLSRADNARRKKNKK